MLTIYRASAGAGKTHKLTGEYLTLLFSAPGAYRRILAVTFTNKATDEMKSRIVTELYQLSSGAPSDYLKALAQRYRLTEQEVRQKAQQILIALLHDYSAFNISTIDRFFQQITRAFTREIGLQGGYGIEMDKDLVLTEAIDSLLNDLAKPENKPLLGWLLRFAEDRIEEGQGWNFRSDIQSLAGELFKESYKAFHQEAATDPTDKQLLERYKETLYGMIRHTEKTAKAIGEQALQLIDQQGLQVEQFAGGSRTPLLLFKAWAQGELKAPTATFRHLADQPEAYTTQKASAALKQQIAQAVQAGLNASVKQAIDLYDQATDYFTAKEIVRYYYTLGILTDISQQVSAYRAKKNVMLIADTTELLSKVIHGSDASFIYEKTGTQIDHYMIDEFQDTSGMQWNNFRPLVEESLAQGKDNLIVGDVKQSIYRFRNSDWTLLDQQVHRDFIPALVREETLQANWRSCHHIVAFNNALFTVAPALLQALYNEALTESSLSAEQQAQYNQQLVKAYTKSDQQIPPRFQGRAGHVCVDFLAGDEENDWKAEALERLPGTIRQLQQNGYALKDMAILVRTNHEGAAVADALLSYKEAHPEDPYRYEIISDEALFISSSPTVRFFIAVFRFLRNPKDVALRKLAQYAYRLISGSLAEAQVADERWVNQLLTYSRYALYELTEALFRLVAQTITDSEQVFAQAFLDKVAEFSQKENADLNDFLNWWDESGYKQTIATPDGQNAIRILTVHKSKGLGFKAVILPFCDWELDHKGFHPVILWCQPQQKPFSQLPLVPVRYGQGLGATHFAADYFHERLNAFMDNLNTLYVAFTRAKEELIICAPRPKKLSKSGDPEKVSSIGDLLWKAFRTEVAQTSQGVPLESLPSHFNPEEGRFAWGDWWHPEVKETESQTEELWMERIASVSPDERLHLRLHGKNFFFDDAKRKHGTVMHEVLSRIHTAKDIPHAIESYQMEGVITQTEATKLAQRLIDLLQMPQVKDWYSDQYRILNEVEILSEGGLTKRPDRVMLRGNEVVVVDYKFGQRLLKSHQAQVRNYLRLIQEMGYSQVSGYLWYVELGKIEVVKPSDSF